MRLVPGPLDCAPHGVSLSTTAQMMAVCGNLVSQRRYISAAVDPRDEVDLRDVHGEQRSDSEVFMESKGL